MGSRGKGDPNDCSQLPKKLRAEYLNYRLSVKTQLQIVLIRLFVGGGGGGGGRMDIQLVLKMNLKKFFFLYFFQKNKVQQSSCHS